MSAQSMSPELIELETRLRARPVEEPTADLRQRVLNAIAHESRQALTSGPDSGSWNIRHWAAVAAAVFVVLNLSMISASQGEFFGASAVSGHPTAMELRTLRQLETQQERSVK
jgi:hypothetical protein